MPFHPLHHMPFHPPHHMPFHPLHHVPFHPLHRVIREFCQQRGDYQKKHTPQQICLLQYSGIPIFASAHNSFLSFAHCSPATTIGHPLPKGRSVQHSHHPSNQISDWHPPTSCFRHQHTSRSDATRIFGNSSDLR